MITVENIPLEEFTKLYPEDEYEYLEVIETYINGQPFIKAAKIKKREKIKAIIKTKDKIERFIMDKINPLEILKIKHIKNNIWKVDVLEAVDTSSVKIVSYIIRPEKEGPKIYKVVS